MRLFATAMMLVATTCCLASEPEFEVSLDLSINGEHVASPQVVVQDGVKSAIDLDGRFIDVVAKAHPKGIMLSFWIGEIDGGVRKVLATPAANVQPGRRMELKVILDDQSSGMREIFLAVAAREHSP